MYTTHNDFVVRAVDVNGEPIRGASVRLMDPEGIPGDTIDLSPKMTVRKKREDQPKLGDNERAQPFAVESPRDSQEDAAGKIDNVNDYEQSQSSSESDERGDGIINPERPTDEADLALDEGGSIVNAETDNPHAMETNDISDKEDDMYRDDRESPEYLTPTKDTRHRTHDGIEQEDGSYIFKDAIRANGSDKCVLTMEKPG